MRWLVQRRQPGSCSPPARLTRKWSKFSRNTLTIKTAASRRRSRSSSKNFGPGAGWTAAEPSCPRCLAPPLAVLPGSSATCAIGRAVEPVVRGLRGCCLLAPATLSATHLLLVFRVVAVAIHVGVRTTGGRHVVDG